ncbi:DUF4123 domain-containing protein [Herbaspirillum robiniae]|uniref:DUF4123 domain-containing protein n=1 Tax=Herbaspirillum robiniae TaxID=2014887 RepID=UPI003D77EBFF
MDDQLSTEQITGYTAAASPPWDDVLQQLHRDINRHGDGRCFVWVDPAQGAPDLGETDPGLRVSVPIVHPHYDQRFAPYLVPLNLGRFSDDCVLAASIELAWNAWSTPFLMARRGQPISGWIIGDRSAREVAAYWARRCYLHFVQGRTRMLRFHDPGVRAMLWQDLDTRQRALLLRPVKAILSLNRHQALESFSAPSTPAVGPDSAAADLPDEQLRLSEQQWQHVNDYATVHAAWSYLVGENLISRHAPVSEALRNSLGAASSYGITSADDRMLFLVCGLRHGIGFHSHARMADVWRRTADGEALVDAIEAVSGRPFEQLSSYLMD